MGLATSRRQARQVVRHGHILVNGKKVNIPSFQCKVGDEVQVRENSKAMGILETAREFAGGLQAVTWIDLNKETLTGKLVALPRREDIQLPVNEQLIVELYSK
jgi:small subunit ribosomal protein S4